MAAFLAGLFVFTLSPASAEEDYKSDRKMTVTDSTANSVAGEGFNLNNKDVTPPGTPERPLGELELAIQEYLMYFDAYRESQQSTDPGEHAKAPQLLRAYRNAYAKALKMMRDDKLIHPMIPQNPLKLYMEKAKDAILGEPKARRRVYKEIRKATKEALKAGKSADEIVSIIKDMIAKANDDWEQGRGIQPPDQPEPATPSPNSAGGGSTPGSPPSPAPSNPKDTDNVLPDDR